MNPATLDLLKTLLPFLGAVFGGLGGVLLGKLLDHKTRGDQMARSVFELRLKAATTISPALYEYVRSLKIMIDELDGVGEPPEPAHEDRTLQPVWKPRNKLMSAMDMYAPILTENVVTDVAKLLELHMTLVDYAIIKEDYGVVSISSENATKFRDDIDSMFFGIDNALRSSCETPRLEKLINALLGPDKLSRKAGSDSTKPKSAQG